MRSSQGEEIGTIKDVVIDRNTGCMAYTVLSTGGGGGRVAGGGGKMVAVPWSVYSPQSDLNTYTVTVERERIFNAPVFDYARIEEYSRPDYINNVYSYYGVSQGVGVGVGFPAALQRLQPAQPRQQQVPRQARGLKLAALPLTRPGLVKERRVPIPQKVEEHTRVRPPRPGPPRSGRVKQLPQALTADPPVLHRQKNERLVRKKSRSRQPQVVAEN